MNLRFKDLLLSQQSRGYILQAILLTALGLLGWWLIDNTITNLTQQNTATGFDFLYSNTGFDVSQSFIDYDTQSSYLRLLLVGVLNTVFVSVLGIIFATILGFSIGIMRLSSNWLVAKLSAIYIEIFRNFPLLIQILFWYTLILNFFPKVRESFSLFDMVFINNRGVYFPILHLENGGMTVLIYLISFVLGGYFVIKYAQKRRENTGQKSKIRLYYVLASMIFLTILISVMNISFVLDVPALKGFNFRGGFALIPELLSLVIALSIYTAAFIAEIVRSGILAVNKGQSEAGYSLGLHRSMILNLIVVPQALRVIIPPLTSQYLNLIKNSSLAAAIAYPELVSIFAGTALNQTGQAVEIIFITMSIYLVLSLTVSFFMNRYNARIALTDR